MKSSVSWLFPNPQEDRLPTHNDRLAPQGRTKEPWTSGCVVSYLGGVSPRQTVLEEDPAFRGGSWLAISSCDRHVQVWMWRRCFPDPKLAPRHTVLPRHHEGWSPGHVSLFRHEWPRDQISHNGAGSSRSCTLPRRGPVESGCFEQWPCL